MTDTAASRDGNVTRVNVAYIRVSREEADDARSLEDQQRGQIDACKRMAARDGAGELVIFSDWSLSADPAKEHRRAAFNDLIKRIEAGDIGTVYARSLDRLYRSIRTFVRLTDACEAHGTRIVTEREGILGGNSPMAQAFSQMTAVFAGMELATSKERAKSRVTRQRAIIEEHERDCPGPNTCGVWHNHGLGHEPYGWRDGESVDDVVEAFGEAGSFLGAARILTARGIPTRRSFVTPNGTASGWNAATVATIIRREVPEAPAPVGRGVRATGAHRFSRLLICPHDGSFLTSSPRRRGRTVYLCQYGRNEGHPRPYAITESAVLDWAKEQAAYVTRLVMTAPPDEAAVRGQVADLLARRERYALLFAEGDISEAQWRDHRDDIDRRVEALRGSVATYLTVENGVRWGGSKARINESLRDICAGIRLGYERMGKSRRKLVPIGATWKVQPSIDTGDEQVPSMLHPDAVAVVGGWYLPARGTRS